jgi:hypothetical protein
MNISILELIELLDDNNDWQSPTIYKVTEIFPVNGEREYEVTNLVAEIDTDGTIMFEDMGNYLQTDMTYVLNMFHLDRLVGIIKNGNTITIKLVDGNIELETIK